jgi:hypothetical protein
MTGSTTFHLDGLHRIQVGVYYEGADLAGSL